ncbi:MAG: tyrosine-type recombinase/integrase [Rhodomicrobium sp.]
MGPRVMQHRAPRYCHHKQDRNGGAGFWYFSRRGYPRVRLPGLPWSPQFMAAYQVALDGSPLQIGASSTRPGTMADLIAKYYSSAAWRALKPVTQEYYRRVIEQIREQHGEKRAAKLEARHIRQLVDRIETPRAARRFLTIMRIILKHGVTSGVLDQNPAFGIEAPTVKKTAGLHSWTEEEILQFESRYAPGTRESLAFALLLYTGQRRADVVRMGPQHVRNGVVSIVQSKTGASVAIPMHPELTKVISASKIGNLAFIVTERGGPFTAKSFGNWFRDTCNAAGLPHCSAHGLRKAAARRLADAGATSHEIASITGHESLREVERYTRAANKTRLAESAQAKVIAAFPRFQHEE